MGDRPHPADYMSDAQYEQFRRDGGVSDFSLDVDITNEGYSPQEQFIMEAYSGAHEDVSEDLWEAVAEAKDHETWTDTAEWFGELDGGDWVTVADGEVIAAGEFHPFRVHVQTH